MNDVFMSYASTDRPRAKMIASALEKFGISVWWDRTIQPGKVFDEVIDEAISSAKCVVVLWSKSSVASDWVKTEASEGLQRKILVPAFIENVRVPLEFRRIQAAGLFDWDGSTDHPEFRTFVEAIFKLLGRPFEEAPSMSPTNAERDDEVLDESRATPQASEISEGKKGDKNRRKKWIMLLVSLAAVVVLSIVLIQVFIKPSNSVLRGKVTDNESRELLGDAKVFLEPSKDSTYTNKQGEYAISDLPPGSYKIYVSHVGYAPLSIDHVNVRSNYTTIQDFQLSSLVAESTVSVGRLQGVVTDGVSGKRLPKAKISVKGTKYSGSASADLKGEYEMVALPGGSYDVRATCAGYSPLTFFNLGIVPNRTSILNFQFYSNRDVPLGAEGTVLGTLQGKVTDKRTGEAMIGANVFIDGTTYGTSTKRDGSYVIPNIPPGIYSVKVAYYGYLPLRRTNVRVDQMKTATVDFQLSE
jgi:hypothetical protein